MRKSVVDTGRPGRTARASPSWQLALKVVEFTPSYPNVEDAGLDPAYVSARSRQKAPVCFIGT
jgi:hypothetical protein